MAAETGSPASSGLLARASRMVIVSARLTIVVRVPSEDPAELLEADGTVPVEVCEAHQSLHVLLRWYVASKQEANDGKMMARIIFTRG